MTIDASTFGPWLVLILVGGFTFFMVQKQGYRWSQIFTGAMLLAALYGNFPTLPQTLNDFMNNIVNTFIN